MAAATHTHTEKKTFFLFPHFQTNTCTHKRTQKLCMNFCLLTSESENNIPVLTKVQSDAIDSGHYFAQLTLSD